MSYRVLVLSGEEIRAQFPIGECIKVVEETYRAQTRGETEVSPKHYWTLAGKRAGAWAGYVRGMDALAVKVVCVRPENPGRGMPRTLFQVILHRPETGEPLAILDGTSITHLRTGAAAAVGAKVLARPESRSVGLVGAGMIARNSLLALCQCFPISRAYVSAINPESRDRLVRELRPALALELVPTSIEEAVRRADILVTATPATQPLVKKEWAPEGLHISAMGADTAGKQEVESAVTTAAHVVCDSREQCRNIGEINVPVRQGLLDPEQVAEIGQVMLSQKAGRTSASQITLYDSTGLGSQDAATAKWIYDTALQRGLGTWVDL